MVTGTGSAYTGILICSTQFVNSKLYEHSICCHAELELFYLYHMIMELKVKVLTITFLFASDGTVKVSAVPY